MSTRIASATLALTTDPSALNKGMKDAENSTKSLKQHFEGLGSVANISADKVASLGSSSNLTGASIASLASPLGLATAGAAALAGAVTGAAVALAAAVKASADYQDNVRDVAIQTGLTTQNISALTYAAGQNGTTMEELSGGLKFLAKNFTDATQEGGAALKAFNAIGISQKELKATNGDLNTVLRMVMDRFNELPKGARATHDMLELLGKGAVNLTEFLSQGSIALDNASKDVRTLGIEVGKGGDVADAYKDQIKKLDAAILGLQISIGDKLIPELTNLIGFTSDLAVELRPVLGTIVDMSTWLAKHTEMGAFAVWISDISKDAPGAATGIKSMAQELPGLFNTNAASMRETLALMKQIAGKPLDEAGATERAAKQAKLAEDAAKAAIKVEDDYAKGKMLSNQKIEKDQADSNIRAGNAIDEFNKSIADRQITAEANLRAILDKSLDEKSELTSQALKDDLKAAVSAMNVLRAEKADQDAFDKKQAEERIKAEREAAESYQRIWEHALGDVTANTIKSFSDILFHGGGFKHDMIDLFKETGEGMFGAIMTGFFAPVTNQLAHLGGRLAGSLFGGGSGGGGIADIASDALNIGGVAGKGGILGATTLSLGHWGGAATAKVAADGTVFSSGGGSGLLGATHALLTNPWTAPIAAGIIGVTAWIKSQAHHEANTWVKRQNQFDTAMAAAASLNEKHGLVGGYLADLKAFSAGGSDEHLVATQARGTFYERYGDPRKYGVTMPQFRMGTAYVPYTGPAIVHQGERIVTAKDNEELAPLLREIRDGLKAGHSIVIDGRSMARVVGRHMNDLARSGEILKPIWGR